MNPFLKPSTIVTGTGAIVVAVAVYFSGIIGSSYTGAILNHLEDIIQGSQTSVVVSLNAPNWGFGVPMATPVETGTATSSYTNATSGLASSTPYSFAVAALDGNGTTTISNIVTVTTDASTTQSKPEVINLKWSAIPGATGYAIYFATTSAATAASQLNQYFVATSSQNYAFATSTGSQAGTYTRSTTTAFSILFSPTGPDYTASPTTLTATSSPVASTTAFQVNGNFAAVAPATTTPCQAATVGTMFYNVANSHLWLCVTAGPYTVVK